MKTLNEQKVGKHADREDGAIGQAVQGGKKAGKPWRIEGRRVLLGPCELIMHRGAD